MTIRNFYEGGMILFSMEAAIQYELWLADMLKHRLKAWWQKPYWLRDLMLFAFDPKDFEDVAFHALPGDPLVPFPDWLPQILLLKSRHLHRLRLNAIKKARREGIFRRQKAANDLAHDG